VASHKSTSGTPTTRRTKLAHCATFIVLTIALIASTEIVRAIGPCCTGTYSLSAVPSATQEGNTVSLILTVSGIASTTSTVYSFRFLVRDPSGTTFQSQPQNYTSSPGQTQFTILVAFPGAAFAGSDTLVGKYTASVDQLMPVPATGVATSTFYIGLTDASEYQRTQTVNILASGYNGSETVTVSIRTYTTSTNVFLQSLQASSGGAVTASWDIPVNATIDTYVLTVSGTTTLKSPPDTQQFSVNIAAVTIASISSQKSSYERTNTMTFSFQPKYPDGTVPSTGVGLINLMGPNRRNVTLTATYYPTTQTFNATYKTSAANQTGTWTASLASHSFTDGYSPYSNSGPSGRVSNSPQLTTAALSVLVSTSTNFVVGQQAKFNATIAYPDGSPLTSGAVSAYFLYSGTPVINDTIPLVFDTGLGLWVGTYTPKTSDTGGLWSLIFKASDSANPSNTGSATRAITLQNNSTPSPTNSSSVPLYYFGIIAALIAGLLIAAFLAFRRRKETHARLKIDLEAVRSEAGRIESQDFFKSIKDQVTKPDNQE